MESQLWRVFNPQARQALPWCDKYENLLSGPLSCYLLNEIRAPEPDLDPFAGLDLPKVKLTDARQTGSPLLSLPLEILYSISDCISDLEDTLSFSLTCRLLLAVALRKLHVELFEQMTGKWINQPLICLGSLTATASDLPDALQCFQFTYNDEQASNPRSVYNQTYRAGSRRHLYYLLECHSTLLTGYDRVQPSTPGVRLNTLTKPQKDTLMLPRMRTPLEKYLERSNSPSWKKRLVERAVLLASGSLRMYPSNIRYALRNTRKKEFFHFECARPLIGELATVFFTHGAQIPLDSAVCIVFMFLISWSPSNLGLEDEMVHRGVSDVHGRWAGDTFDVCRTEEIEDGWTDVAAETVQLLRVYLPRMYRNMHGQDRFGEPSMQGRSRLFRSMGF
ncbi:hypothetical protein H072_6659 [Dactylellina haptotyla CBS 200.50]|uniref:Uncharacterized protein n=1 Tax=Dactylellina haptotyla (strain CBS 200.50) TaxID=1284197 RepID=S8A9H7_DACHA|nr:hypothetical protein H072_6659 [Dactylellina haptotyla CBS 200.50]